MIADIRNNPSYFEKDPKKKNTNWGNELITMYRANWQPIVDSKRAKKGMDYLMSKQDMDYVLSGFKENSKFVKNLKKAEKVIPIAVWDRISNIIISEYKKSTYKPQVNAIDPASKVAKERDKNIIKNRSFVVNGMNSLKKRVGDPPFKIPKEEFAGNLELFDEMGLDDTDPTDLNFFFSTFYRLNHEISAQELLWALMEYNHFDEHIDYLVRDVLAKKAVSFQVYTSPSSGEIKWKYIDPLKIKAIKGDSKHFRDGICIGYEKRVNVRQFLEFAGPSFDFERDKRVLLLALQSEGNAQDWIDITRQGGVNEKGEVVCSWGRMMQFQVTIGYMEWKSVEGVAGKRHKKTKLFYEIDYSTEVGPNSSYEKEVSEYQKTYKSWFLSTGAYSQYLFHFGPLYHQLTEGAHDEYSGFSLYAMVLEGLTAVETGEPFIDIANKAFYKMLWAIDEALPRKRIYNYEALVKLATKVKGNGTSPSGMQPANRAIPGTPAVNTGVANQVEELVSHMVDSLYELYTIPEIDGQRLGGNQRPHYWDEGGLDPIAVAMQTILDWAEAQISNRLGFNALRDAYSPDPKDGLKLNLEALKQSRNATHYIPDMLGYVLRQTSVSSMLRAQDGIEFKGTPIYEFILNLIGEDAIDDFKALNRIPAHRFGIFVSVLNIDERREEFKVEARDAYVKGDISYDQYFVLKEYEDPKKAGKVLAFYKYKNEKKKEQEAALAHQRAMELQQAKVAGEIAVEDRKGFWSVREKEVWGEWYMRAHQIPADAAIQKKQMDIESNDQKMNEKARSEIVAEEGKESVRRQQPIPAAPAST